MSVLNAQMVSAYANYLLTRIDQDDEAPIGSARPGTVTTNGLTGTFHVTDSDGAALEVTIRPAGTARQPLSAAEQYAVAQARELYALAGIDAIRARFAVIDPTLALVSVRGEDRWALGELLAIVGRLDGQS